LKNTILDTTPLTGAYWKDNYLWGIGMQLCWNQLSEDIVGGPVQLTFWLIMKKVQSPQPYLVFKVNNIAPLEQA